MVYLKEKDNMTIYHAVKPNYLPEIFEPSGEGLFSGWQSVGWNTDMALANSVYQGLSTYSSVNSFFDDEEDDHLTVQFQHWWGEQLGVNMLHWDYYGINTSIRMSANVQTLSHGGDATAYGTFYIRGIDTTNDERWWLQFSFMDERGDLPDMFKFDQYTGEAVLESQIGSSAYSSLHPDSYGMSTGVDANIQFKSVIFNRFNAVDVFDDMNNDLGTNFSLEPGLHKIIAFGVTYELGQEAGNEQGWLIGNIHEAWIVTESMQ